MHQCDFITEHQSIWQMQFIRTRPTINYSKRIFQLMATKVSLCIMGLNQSEINHGWMYYPRFQLIVWNDRISGLSGDVKLFEKHNIAQYDTNLRFFTRKFDCSLTGMIMKTSDRKYTTRLLLNYKVFHSLESQIQNANRSFCFLI